MTDMGEWSAARTASAITSGEISAVEATEAALSRIDTTNPSLNAVIEIADGAIDTAREADARLRRGDGVGPLHGVPILVKPNTDLAGHSTHDGVEAFLGATAEETAPGLSGLTDAGCVIIGRTNVPSFSLRWCAENEHWGRTLNPWDPQVTPGGSSGGSAAAVASRMVPLAHGNDLGGSVRYPAAVCGIVGLRPTVGRVPVWHGTPGYGVPLGLTQFAVEGALARSTEDLRVALSAMERFDPRDPIAAPQTHLGRPLHSVPTRVALVVDPGTTPFSGPGTAETDEVVREVGRALADAGYLVEEVTLPSLGEAATLWFELMFTEFRASGVPAVIEGSGAVGAAESMRLWTEIYDSVMPPMDLTSFVAAWARRHVVRRRVAEFMERYPLLLLPNSGEPAFAHGDDIRSADRAHQLLKHQWPNMAIPVLGLPAAGVGTHISVGSAPIGVQVVGRSFSEESILEVMDVIEQQFGPFGVKP